MVEKRDSLLPTVFADAEFMGLKTIICIGIFDGKLIVGYGDTQEESLKTMFRSAMPNSMIDVLEIPRTFVDA